MSTDASEHLGLKLADRIGQYTAERWTGVGLENASLYQKYADHGQSIRALRQETVGEGDSAIIIGAGPSMEAGRVAQRIVESGYKGAVIATECGLKHCLPHGLVPDVVVTVDPRPRVVRWLGYPKLTKEQIEATDYYRLKDLDPFWDVEIKMDCPIYDLVNQYGPRMRMALPTSASEQMVQRVIEAGLPIYWWNPMYDDPDQPDSVTARLQKANGLPAINAGGNVGAASWMIAYAVLGKRRIALTGMDYSIPDGSPLTALPHYRTCANLVGEDRVGELAVRIHNPFDGKSYLTDPTYIWYRNAFLEMVADAEDCRTINCTESGVLFGERLEFGRLGEFLGNCI